MTKVMKKTRSIILIALNRAPTSYGQWEQTSKNTIKATYVPKDGHGPVLAYTLDINNAVISCDFKLTPNVTKDNHFRIFLDHPNYRGHTINAVANLGSAFRPVGVSLQHLQKDARKNILEDIEFGVKPFATQPGQWHTMKVTLIDDYVKIQVDDIIIEGRSKYLNVTKHKIGLNPGIAGGEIRNFKVTAYKK